MVAFALKGVLDPKNRKEGKDWFKFGPRLSFPEFLTMGSTLHQFTIHFK